MMPTLKPVVLGTKPFVLIEFALNDDETIDVSVQSGGGIDSADVPEMLRDLGQQFLDEGKGR